jgi:hypothetical protein
MNAIEVITELAPLGPPYDEYNDTVLKAAAFMVGTERSKWEYCTQWARGATLWAGPNEEKLTLPYEILDNAFTEPSAAAPSKAPAKA